MSTAVATHYGGAQNLADMIAEELVGAGYILDQLTTSDLAGVDEFHIRGRQATLELAALLGLEGKSHVLDVGSGLGGPARVIAETYGSTVTGIDLTPSFCDAARAMSQWVGLAAKLDFVEGDATYLPFDGGQFDAALSVHVGMNIAAKDEMYAEVHRVLKPGAIFGVYDVLQGEGGDVLYPVPWAREPSISHLVDQLEMKALLKQAGFSVIDTLDSTERSQAWFEALLADTEARTPPVSFRVFLGDDFPDMARTQVRNLTERRIRTVTFICRA